MPTSVYNLRKSHSVSTQGTPVKGSSPIKMGSPTKSPIKMGSPAKSPAKSLTKSPTKIKEPSPSKKSPFAKSPAKKVRKISILLEDIPNMPLELANILGTAGLNSMDDLINCEEGTLLGLLQPVLIEDEKMKKNVQLKKEILTAWIRCLLAHSKDPKSSLSWGDWVETKLTARSRSMSSHSTEKLILSRGELVRQRQTLKKSKGPTKKTISSTELRDAKAKLTTVPLGKALKDKVKPDVLQQAKQNLKKMC